MQKRSRKNNVPMKEKSKNRKYIEKQCPSTWCCRICQHQNSDSYQYCVSCFIDLHYYTYVNMHMFVASDNSYKEVYYQVKDNSDDTSLQSLESESESEDDQMQVEIDWVETLLEDE